MQRGDAVPSPTPFTERTATELSNFLECSERASLDLVRDGKLARPGQNDIERRLLAMRGTEHERGVLGQRVRGLV
jgi:hypothetical protein